MTSVVDGQATEIKHLSWQRLVQRYCTYTHNAGTGNGVRDIFEPRG